MTSLFLSNLCKNIIKKSFIDIFPNQVLNFLNIFTEHGKIITDYTKSIEKFHNCFVGMLLKSNHKSSSSFTQKEITSQSD